MGKITLKNEGNFTWVPMVGKNANLMEFFTEMNPASSWLQVFQQQAWGVVQVGPRTDRYKMEGHSKGPINGKKNMGNWGYNLYKWSYGPLLVTGFWAHLVRICIYLPI